MRAALYNTVGGSFFCAQEAFIVLLKLMLLFTLVPMIELYLLWEIKEVITWEWTIALILFTGFVGALLARKQGLSWRHRLHAELTSGQVPTTSLLDGLMIFIAGAFLITPGVLTDAVGFLLLVPLIRSHLRERIKVRLMRGVQAGFNRQDLQGQSTWPRDVIIESHIIEQDPEDETADRDG